MVFFDVISRFFTESKKCNDYCGIANTPLSLFKGLWTALWGVESKEKPNELKRFLMSSELRIGLGWKFIIYSFVISMGIWVIQLPDWVLFGQPIDESLSHILLLTPILIELYSIFENLLAINRNMFKQAYKALVFVRDFLKG